MNRRMILTLLSILSGLMLGFSFPPSSVGVLACFGLIPLLIVLGESEKNLQAFGYTYLAMMVFHLITLNWTGGYEHGNDPYMMIAGGVTMFVHPFFYFVPVSLYLFVRKRLGDVYGLAGFVLFWVAYEYSHSLSEWSFPWLTIGNSHTYDLARIQFISSTGVFGLSFLILLMNAVGYRLFLGIRREGWGTFSGRSVAAAGVMMVLYMAPKFHGEAVLADPDSSGPDSVSVGIVQANLDPWEKWRRDVPATLGLYLSLTDSLIGSTGRVPEIVLWPETAIPARLLSPGAASIRERIQSAVDARGISLVTGFPHMSVYPDSGEAPPSSKRISLTGERYDDFNAAAFFQPGDSAVPWYGKMKMVPLAERVPYADAFYLFDFLRWGVGIGGWQIGPDSVLFLDQKTGTRFSSVICYESTYPAFVASFVRKGADLITILTIDSWWGRMSGAYQHKQFSVLRAVENRRWIARCALGGFSCFIDPFGRIHDETRLFERTVISRTVPRRSDLTFYTEHGEWLPQICLLLGTALLLSSVIPRIGAILKQRERAA
ncbi:MAG: apolipoprotein N-acyltransferase [Ignavibacteria bacterium]|nr:apolipoprotein N-acyltransferase [Ignavibacteria bacterium]